MQRLTQTASGRTLAVEFGVLVRACTCACVTSHLCPLTSKTVSSACPLGALAPAGWPWALATTAWRVRHVNRNTAQHVPCGTVHHHGWVGAACVMCARARAWMQIPRMQV